jgi:hypothetical protein
LDKVSSGVTFNLTAVQIKGSSWWDHRPLKDTRVLALLPFWDGLSACADTLGPSQAYRRINPATCTGLPVAVSPHRRRANKTGEAEQLRELAI